MSRSIDQVLRCSSFVLSVPADPRLVMLLPVPARVLPKLANTDGHAEDMAATAHAATPALGALATAAMAVWKVMEEFACSLWLDGRTGWRDLHPIAYRVMQSRVNPLFSKKFRLGQNPAWARVAANADRRYHEGMFDPPTPEELIHARYREAALAGNVQAVRQILAEHPEAVDDPQRMPSTVLQAVCLDMYSFNCRKEQVECMLAIVEAGADLAKGYNYTDSPIAILLQRAITPALRALQDKGFLASAIRPEDSGKAGTGRGVRGVGALHFVCLGKQWRDLDRNYPLAELVEILLEAGADTQEVSWHDQPVAIANSAAAQLLRSMADASGPVPDSAAQALSLMMEHDKDLRFDEYLVLRAWRTKVEPVFEMVAQRFFDHGGTHDQLQALAASTKMKPQMAAKLQGDALKVMTPGAPGARSKPSNRF